MVTLTATLAEPGKEEGPSLFSAHVQTVSVGGRCYALSLLVGLQPATWYNYRVSSSEQESSAPVVAEGASLQCFRTLDLPDGENVLRLAYGSCRKLSATEPDALSALGAWLLDSVEQRDAVWPHLLLLIGDQIYADDAAGGPEQPDPASQAVPTQSYADFAMMYTQAWSDKGVQQVFAVLPTYMIFDDHEITNSWNTSTTWRKNALQHGFERSLVDGLVAYWVYQGWGNIGIQGPADHALLAIMQQATQSGEDVLEALRVCVRQVVYQERVLKWHYEIPTRPPLFVADVRSDRPAILDGTDPTNVALRIMSEVQMVELRAWMQKHAAVTTLLVSSVPAILPPMIGLAEYVMGARPLLQARFGLFRRLGQVMARVQQKIALRMSFDHWPVFGGTWRELAALLAMRTADIVILSGDVHFSYAISARRTLFPGKNRPVLYQLVASPFKNDLALRDKRLVTEQSWIRRIVYGGMYMRVLPLYHARGEKRLPHDMLFKNVVALVTFWPCEGNEGRYTMRQVYLGVEGKKMVEVGSIDVRA
jgi:hypothetical protein